MKKNGLADLAQLASLGGLRTTPASERACAGCGQPLDQCRCEALAAERARQAAHKSAAVRVWLETKGRRGKGMTVVKGLPLDGAALDDLARQLKTRCGSGGSVKDGELEIQGDHRDTVLAALLQLGFAAKRAGG